MNAASLADINQRLSEKAKPRCADVSRFRPNLLVEGAPAFVEDSWASLEIGGAVFENAGMALDPVSGPLTIPCWDPCMLVLRHIGWKCAFVTPMRLTPKYSIGQLSSSIDLRC